MSWFADVRGVLERYAHRAHDQDFVEATMAAAALLAYADGRITMVERLARDEALDRLAELRVLPADRAVTLFRGYAEAFKEDPGKTREQILEKVTPFKGEPELARLIVQVCVYIARSDRHFDETEREVIQELASALRVKLEELEDLPFGEET